MATVEKTTKGSITLEKGPIPVEWVPILKRLMEDLLDKHTKAVTTHLEDVKAMQAVILEFIESTTRAGYGKARMKTGTSSEEEHSE